MIPRVRSLDLGQHFAINAEVDWASLLMTEVAVVDALHAIVCSAVYVATMPAIVAVCRLRTGTHFALFAE